jgi:hypothetical protein
MPNEFPAEISRSQKAKATILGMLINLEDA